MSEVLLQVADHLERVLDAVEVLSPLELLLGDAHGSTLAEDVSAGIDLPPFDNASMDGYAVLSADVATASSSTPVALDVVGDVPAGRPAGFTVLPGTTARIMTGAVVPDGVDLVVPLEWTNGGTATVRVTRTAEPGTYIRRRGDDVRAGEVVLTTGTRLGATQVGLLAAIGRQRVLVHPRPRVVVISTGSELVEPGTTPGPGQINDSNSYLITAAAKEAGAQVYNVGIVGDEPRALLGLIEDQLIRADLVITTGGVSVGAYDVVKEVLSRLGTVRFDRVAMQPGMPQGFGTVGPDATPIFTLPGNPVSAYVSFEVFVRPALRRMLGVEPLQRPVLQARCPSGLRSPAGKQQYHRMRLESSGGVHVVHPVGGTGSHLLADLAHANALAIVPAEVTEVPPGGTVDVMVLERRSA